MKNRRGGLGRGLGALIPTGLTDSTTVPGAVIATIPDADPGTQPAPTPAAPPEPPPIAEMASGDLAPVPGARFREVPVGDIAPNPRQPRQVFEETAFEELKASIQQVGLLQPIVVRELSPGRYELVMGERRWRAASALGLELIPAIIRDTRDDEMLRDALLENIHRAQLNPLEEAAAYQQLLDEFGATHEDLAKRIGRSRPQISNTIRLLNLPAPVQRRVAAGVLSAGHARALLGLSDPVRQDELAKRIVAEGLSVRATEEIVALGEVEQAPHKPAVRKAKPHSPGVTELADRLSDRFDTRVKVDLGKRKGRIVVEFATVDDLQRIVDLMGLDGPSTVDT
ncbi:MAG: ParB/RepB/Spo0J family partition protein [Micromonosporaceae bacterium]